MFVLTIDRRYLHKPWLRARVQWMFSEKIQVKIRHRQLVVTSFSSPLSKILGFIFFKWNCFCASLFMCSDSHVCCRHGSVLVDLLVVFLVPAATDSVVFNAQVASVLQRSLQSSTSFFGADVRLLSQSTGLFTRWIRFCFVATHLTHMWNADSWKIVISSC